jgi:hypothetical protein
MRIFASVYLMLVALVSAWVLLSVTGIGKIVGLGDYMLNTNTIFKNPTVAFGVITISATLLVWAIVNLSDISDMNELGGTDLVTDYVFYAAVPLVIGLIFYIAARLGVAAGSSDLGLLVPQDVSPVENLQKKQNTPGVAVSKAAYFLLGARAGFRPIPTMQKVFGAASLRTEEQARERNEARQREPKPLENPPKPRENPK